MRASTAQPRGESSSCANGSASPAEIDAVDELGDRVLDLQARVHLEEVEAAVLVHDEFDRPRVDVADVARETDGGRAELRA
jgi:hypothetical protein